VVTGGAEQVDAGVLLGAEFNIGGDPEHPSPFAKVFSSVVTESGSRNGGIILF